MESQIDTTTDIRTALEPLGFPPFLMDSWVEDGITTLLPIQLQALKEGALDKTNCLIVGPTSCGKTFIGELICIRHTLQRRRCLYLVPFKALAEEKYDDFCRKYAGDKVGARITISTQDHRDDDRRIAESDFDIAILTYEKMSALFIACPTIVQEAGALIVDEIQMVSDRARGANLELLLTRIRQISRDIQIIGLSAVVSALNKFDTWLNAHVIKNDHRPVVLREGVLTPSGRFSYREWDGSIHENKSDNLARLTGQRKEDYVVSLVSQLLKNADEQVLVFANSITMTQRLARDIAAAAGLPPAQNTLQELAALEITESIELLCETLAHSVAFHNADLTRDERHAIEKGFRGRAIRCIVATSTLSMGVNLPASSVIIATPKRWIRDAAGRFAEIDISVAEYRNMSGRAGRFGLQKDKWGTSFLIAASPFEQESLLNFYVHGSPEPIESAFLSQSFEQLLLIVLASGLCDTADSSRQFLLNTYAAVQLWDDSSKRASLVSGIQEAILLLQEYRLINTDATQRISVTDAGRICAASGLGLETFAKLSKLLESPNLSANDVAFIASRCRDTGPDSASFRFSTDEYRSRTPSFVRSIRESLATEPSQMTQEILDAIPEHSLPAYHEAKALKYHTAAIAYVYGIASRRIEDEIGVSAARARAIGANCAWLADTAAKVAWVTGHVDRAKRCEVLAERFRSGCSEAALILAQVPHRLHRAEREDLIKAGFTSLQTIIDTDSTDIAKMAHIDRRRIEGLQKGIVRVLGDRLTLERQQIARLRSIRQPVALLENLYSANGTRLEQAIVDLLEPPFCIFTATRITKQRHAEADIKLIMGAGYIGIAQVNAKERPTEKIGINKAVQVLHQSPELNPQIYMCFGRPDFLPDTIGQVENHVRNGKNFKLIPLYVLAEMYVRFQEGKIGAERIAAILEKETGYISIQRISAG